MTPEQIAELEALAEKATPGPWRAFCGATHTRVYSDADGTVQVAEIAGPSDVGIRPWNGERWEADASLISVLVNNLPAILAALKVQQPDDAMVRDAIYQLAYHQQQADMDGCMVTVSRQALDEVLVAIAAMQESRDEG